MSSEKPSNFKMFDDNREVKNFDISYDYCKEGLCNVHYMEYSKSEHYGSFSFDVSELRNKTFSLGYTMFIRTNRNEPDELFEKGGGPYFSDYQELDLNEAKHLVTILARWIKEHEDYLEESSEQ